MEDCVKGYVPWRQYSKFGQRVKVESDWRRRISACIEPCRLERLTWRRLARQSLTPELLIQAGEFVLHGRRDRRLIFGQGLDGNKIDNLLGRQA